MESFLEEISQRERAGAIFGNKGLSGGRPKRGDSVSVTSSENETRRAGVRAVCVLAFKGENEREEGPSTERTTGVVLRKREVKFFGVGMGGSMNMSSSSSMSSSMSSKLMFESVIEDDRVSSLASSRDSEKSGYGEYYKTLKKN